MNKTRKFSLIAGIISCIFCFNIARANQFKEQINITWNEKSTLKNIKGELVPSFDEAQLLDNMLPYWVKNYPISNYENQLNVSIENPTYIPLNPKELSIYASVVNTPKVSFHKSLASKNALVYISILPFRKNPATGIIEKLVSFTLLVNEEQNLNSRTASVPHAWAASSVLAAGEWYKISTTKDAVYKITYPQLKSLGINVGAIDPRNIKIYGFGGGQLPYENNNIKYDDLPENAIEVVGESDGKFDQGDYILFYGESQLRWHYNRNLNQYEHSNNNYSDTTYYFINIANNPGARISNLNFAGSANVTVTDFDDYDVHEVDLINFEKSGKEWYGEAFDYESKQAFAFSFLNINTGKPASLRVSTAIRSLSGTTGFRISANGTKLADVDAANVSDYYLDSYVSLQDHQAFIPNPGANAINVGLELYKSSPASAGWLNFIECNVRRNLIFNPGNQLIFRDISSVGPGKVANFQIQNFSGGKIWDVSDPLHIKNIPYSANGAVAAFTNAADTLHQYVAHDGSYQSPGLHGKVNNQNLHALSAAPLLIISHPLFWDEAEKIAKHHRDFDKMNVIIVSPQQIYNEFSSGSQDIIAIRRFLKMFYDRSPNKNNIVNYVILLGDGSYDNKHRIKNNTNFVATYQSENSTNPTYSYTSDDFIALLDDNEGNWESAEVVDLSVGRFPVQNSEEAKTIVDKTIHYATSPDAFGDWRNKLGFVADDQEDAEFVKDSEKLAKANKTVEANNVEKIYFDAFKQESTPAGQRYPEVTTAINNLVDKGALVINYIGHGGEVGWAHERVLNISDIQSWTNYDRLALFLTATCEFSRFDDPARTSAGELTILNPKGGAVGLLTTVRVVYSYSNFILDSYFFKSLYEPVNGQMPRIGDIYEKIKIASAGYSNSRNFTLLGDPALRLAYPELNAITTKIDGKAITSNSRDTISALGKVTIEGMVTDKNGQKLSSFNGLIFPTIFDKKTLITTLSNDGAANSSTSDNSPPVEFDVQKNIIYKGKVSVINGDFKFSFIVPKDIAYKYGNARISYYTNNDSKDGKGIYDSLVIGGISKNPVNDNVGPDLKLFMNDDKFVNGGITNSNPKIFAVLKDSSGINTVGNGIGHDIVATLDGITDKAYVLNDYYQSDLNSYQNGKVSYPLRTVAEGKHTLKLKAWDILNNSSETQIDFVVASSEDFALKHVLNYPNPFTTNTDFYFEHNKPGIPLEVSIQIFTVSGKLIKTILVNMTSDGFRSNGINWNGLDNFGEAIGKGVYIYKLQVRTPDGKSKNQFEKLVLLR